jgi:hypothetical protein
MTQVFGFFRALLTPALRILQSRRDAAISYLFGRCSSALGTQYHDYGKDALIDCLIVYMDTELYTSVRK